MERLRIEVVENATKTVSFLPETPFEKVLADCMTDYLEMRKDEEQGLMLRLPCKVGTLVYEAYSNELSGVDEHRLQLEDIPNFGKTVFLTREEAEQALAEMKGV